ncbi:MULTISPECIES: 2TM domain-containing protein [Myxococcus]|uniref:2TM domain-containing protein n=1 Tax=Myxococcus TaxID=32 RepID=UPI0013D09D5B|nr:MULTISPECIES: 2TM domain-containing protein [Myxococcus]NVJ21697.1 2TM domain-containing protein [Myxococcus sp. AM011]
MADTRPKAPPTHFTEREAAELIREASAHALTSQASERPLTREEVLAMAREMGLSEASVEVALAARGQKDQDRQKLRKDLLGLATHGFSYTIVIGALTLIDVLTGPSWWVVWPAIGWGIGLAFHAMGVTMTMARRALKVEDDE